MSGIQAHVRVFHKDKNGVLHSLESFDLSKSIHVAISRGERSIGKRSVSSRDLKRLEAMGIRTEEELDVVLEYPWDGRCFMNTVLKSNGTQLRRKVLVMALERICRVYSLSRILALKGLPMCTVRKNPYLRPGHLPHDNFIESLLEITDINTPGGRILLELFLESASDEAKDTTFTAVEERGVRTVFHGTNHAVMDAILQSGLSPHLRRIGLREDYFGVDYGTSLSYTKKKTSPQPVRCKLLVFLIIVQQIGPLQSRGAVTVASNNFQLPVAEITL